MVLHESVGGAAYDYQCANGPFPWARTGLGAAADGGLIQQAYIRKTVDTLNDLDNVIWEIANEAGAGSETWQNDMMTYLRNYEAGKPVQHPIGRTFAQGRFGRCGTEVTPSVSWRCRRWAASFAIASRSTWA